MSEPIFFFISRGNNLLNVRIFEFKSKPVWLMLTIFFVYFVASKLRFYVINS